MLIIKRSIGEHVLIGENIKITYRGTRDDSNQIRLSIDAPREINIRREEAIKVKPRHKKDETLLYANS